MKRQDKKTKMIARHRRVRAKVIGSAKRPRLSVFRSNRHVYAQLIDDDGQKTLLSVSDTADAKTKKTANKGVAYEIGKRLAAKAGEKGIKKIVFDRGGYKFHGRIMELARGAREGGLDF